jgi:hypothetical protein
MTRIPEAGREQLVDFVHGLQLKCPHLTCLMESVVAKPSDSWLDRYRDVATTHEEDVYFVASSSTSRDELLNRVSQAETMPFFYGILAEVSQIESGPGDIPTRVVQQWCDNWHLAFVGAYDGEGYVFIERQVG